MPRKILRSGVVLALTVLCCAGSAPAAPPTAPLAPIEVRVKLAVLPGSKFAPAWAHLLGRAKVSALLSENVGKVWDAAKIDALEPEHLASVTIINKGEDTHEDLKIEVELSGYSDVATETVTVGANKQRTVKLTPSFHDKLFMLREQTGGTVRVRVTTSQGASLYDKTTQLTLLSVNDMMWHLKTSFDLAPMVCSFVTPRTPEVDLILAKAADKMPGRSIGGYMPGIGGFSWTAQEEKNDPKKVDGKKKSITRAHLKAIYNVMADMGVHYVNTPLSFGGGQQIKYIDQVLAKGAEAANCIEGTLAFASCLEAMGMRPIIVIVPGHAFVGCFTWRDSSEVIWNETTMVGNSTYEKAEQEAAAEYAHYNGRKEVYWFIPVDACRQLGITPTRRPGAAPATREVKHVLVKDDKDPAHWIACGRDHITRSQNDVALHDFSKAIEVEPQHEEAFCERARTKHLLGDFKGAVKDCSMSIMINARSWRGYYQRGASHYAMQKFKEAIEDWKKALDLGPPNAADIRKLIETAQKKMAGQNQTVDNDIEALRKSAETAHANKDWARAIELLTKVLGSDPDWGRGWTLRAIAHYHLKMYKEAVADCDEAIRHGMLDAYGTKGSSHYMMGDFRDAVAAWETYIKHFPDEKATFQPWIDKAKEQYKEVDTSTDTRWDKDKAHPWVSFSAGSSTTWNLTQVVEGESSSATVKATLLEKTSTQIHLQFKTGEDTSDEWKDIRDFIEGDIGLEGKPKWTDEGEFNVTVQKTKVVAQKRTLAGAVAANGARLDVTLFTAREAAAVGGVVWLEVRSQDGKTAYRRTATSLSERLKLQNGKTVACVKYRDSGMVSNMVFEWEVWMSPDVPGWIVRKNGTKGANRVSMSWDCVDFSTKAGGTDTAGKVEEYLDKLAKLLAEKKNVEAIRLATEAIRKFPKNHMLYYYRAVAHYNNEQDQEAMSDLETTIKLSPGYAHAYRLRGLIHYYGKNWTSAVQDLQYAIELNPDLKGTTQKYLDEARKWSKGGK